MVYMTDIRLLVDFAVFEPGLISFMPKNSIFVPCRKNLFYWT